MIFSKIDHCVYCVCVHAQRQCNKSKLVFTEMPDEGGGEALCVEIGFYVDISWESGCNSEMKV